MTAVLIAGVAAGLVACGFVGGLLWAAAIETKDRRQREAFIRRYGGSRS